MPIVNSNYYRIYPTHTVTVSLPEIFHTHNVLGKGLFWYIEVCDNFSFDKELWASVLPALAIDKLKKGSMKLIVNNYHEAFTEIVDPLYKLLVLDYGINEQNIVLVTSARDIGATVSQVATCYNKKPINVLLSSELDFYIQQQEKRNKIHHNRNSNVTKKFINLNRRWRSHRTAFVALLSVHNLLEYGYVSLMEFEGDNWHTRWDNMLVTHPKLQNIFKDHKEQILSIPNLIVDSDDLSSTPAYHPANEISIYQDSYFSVVSETYYYNNKTRFITEKTLRTIVSKHPFILLAPPRSLDFFREKGYKTFSPFINEDYDSIVNDDDRMLMVLEETKRLCQLNHNELNDFVEGTKEICDHNYDLFMTKDHAFIPISVDNN